MRIDPRAAGSYRQCGFPANLGADIRTRPVRELAARKGGSVPAGYGCVRQLLEHGVGGACTSGGSGLRGLADRLNALGGTLSIDSPPGGPTRITRGPRC